MDLTQLPLVGRLKHCLKNWQLICKDPCVLQAIEGYQIDFTSLPYQSRYPQGIIHTQAKSNLIENEVQDLLTKQAIHPVSVGQRQDGFVSHLFLVPKKRGCSETSNKFKAFESICEVQALQNGKYLHAARPTKTRRISGQNRFEGCLLHNSHLGKPPKISEVSLE